ncbi:MAG TPA: hypothetical protein VFR24_17970 [Candidatus Angelobacter sp.]|nr:hypothetical protein [Candidatus Angelobacter sp.]
MPRFLDLSVIVWLLMHLPEIEWKPVSRTAFFAWLGFYTLLLIYLAAHLSEPTFLDNLHLPIHEGGHLLFGWFGATLGLWGGTLLQLIVPAALVITFVVRADLFGTTFCSVAFFHSLTGVATYMSDALRRQLTLVTVGAPADEADHDWVRIFSDLGVLPHAIQIGNATRVIAWLGLLGTMAWFCWRYYNQASEKADRSIAARQP